MKYLVIILSFFLCPIFLLSQSPDSLSMRNTYLWDKASLPSDGSVKYNDLWGWTDSDGTEYAILGNVDSIFFIDVTDPFQPITVDSFYAGSRSLWRDFKTYGDYVYMCADENSEGLTIFDMSTLPGSVTWIDQSNQYFDRAHNIFIDTTSGRLYAFGTDSGSAREGLVILDLTADPENPDSLLFVQLDSVRNGTMTADWYYIHDGYVRNDTVYASHGNLGYFIWDCTDLNDINLLASYEDDNPGYNHSGWNTADNSHAIFVCEIPRGVPVYILPLDGLSDVSPPILDSLRTFKNPLESPTAVDNTPHNPFVKGDTLIISYYEDGVQVYDISDLSDPTRIAYYDTEPNNITYHGTTNNWGVYPFFPSGTIIASDTEYGMFVLQIDESIVPVRFIDIRGYIRNESSIEVQWETALEINNEKFIIERSVDGIEFIEIGEVYPKKNDGESGISNQYTFFDNSPRKGNNYYRIKQLDFDGKSSYSSTIQLAINLGFGYKIFPNPLIDEQLKIQVQSPGAIQVEIFDGLGALVYNISMGDYSKSASVVLTPQIDLADGVYFVRVISDGFVSKSQKLIVNKASY